MNAVFTSSVIPVDLLTASMAFEPFLTHILVHVYEITVPALTA